MSAPKGADVLARAFAASVLTELAITADDKTRRAQTVDGERAYRVMACSLRLKAAELQADADERAVTS